MPYFPPQTGGGSSNSAGLAGTGIFAVTYIADPTLPNERILTAGSSVVVRTDATAIYIDALTSASVSTNIGTGGFLQLQAQAAKLYPNTSAARIDAGTPTWRLLFSPTTQQYGVWQFVLPNDYSGSPAVQLIFSSDSSLSVAKSVNWVVDQWGYGNSQSSIYVDTYAGANSTTIALSAGYSAGLIQILTVPLANTNSLNAGNLIKLRVSSSAGNVTGNQELVGLGLFYRAGTQTIASGSGGLAGTGNSYVSWSADDSLNNEKVLTAGTNISIVTDSTTIKINAVNKDFNFYYHCRSDNFVGAVPSPKMYLAAQANATALATAVININSAQCLPFITTQNIKIDTMACNVTIAGSATTQIQLGIYSNSGDYVLHPLNAISTSSFLTGTNLGLVAYNPGIMLSANNLYWFTYLCIRSSVTLRSIAVGGCWSIYGTDSGMGTAPGIGIQMLVSSTNGLPATMPASGNTISSNIPALAVRGSI